MPSVLSVAFCGRTAAENAAAGASTARNATSENLRTASAGQWLRERRRVLNRPHGSIWLEVELTLLFPIERTGSDAPEHRNLTAGLVDRTVALQSARKRERGTARAFPSDHSRLGSGT